MLLSFIGLQAQTWPPIGMAGDGTSNNPWQITDSTHLRALADYINVGNGDSTLGKYYKLMNDIDLIGYSNWMPIGRGTAIKADSTTSFRGNFNGNNKMIHNLIINRPSEYSIGLFGRICTGTIENLGVENCNVIGGYYLGGLVGDSYQYSSIFNCYVEGNISGNSSIGGLVGSNAGNSVIFNCYAKGGVSGSGSDIGGLVGFTQNSHISNCYSTCNVRGYSKVGGLIGDNLGYINYCYATGKVVGESYVVGGLVGGDMGTIYNCIATNDTVISNINPNNTTNRMIGSTYGTYKNNYALNSMVVLKNGLPVAITDSSNAAGIGKNINTFHDLSFYTTPSNWATNMWDIDSATAIWKICDGHDLPFLRWQGIDCYYSIEAITNDNGNISPSGTISVMEGISQNFTFSANNCYEIDSLWIDDIYSQDSITQGNYTFKNITKNHTIAISFKLKNYFSSDSVAICSDDSYYFNEQSLTQAGIYYDTLQTISSCDSIIELIITVNPNYFVLDTVTISQGETYIFFGKLLTEQGIYYDTLQTVYGCDSIFELNLMYRTSIVERQLLNIRIYPNPTSSQLTIESGQLTIDKIEIFDVMGRLQIAESRKQNREMIVDISHLPTGIYFLKIKTKIGIVTQKVIKY